MAWSFHVVAVTANNSLVDFHTGRVWKKSVQYDVRKNFADTRLRVKGRFVKKEDEVLLKELVGLA